MKRGIVLLSLLLALRVAVVQGRTSSSPNPQAEATNHSGEASGSQASRDTHPRAVYAPDPDYPTKGRNGLTGGMVVLWITVGSDGRPHDIEVARSLSPGFDEAAVKAVKKWKFAPATKDGKRVPVRTNVEVVFRTN